MVAGLLGGTALGAAGLMAYGVRGKSSTWFAPSIWHGPRDRRIIALTFDDGPSESTPELLDILAEFSVPATFFQIGANVRRLPEVARAVTEAGHETGNHSDTHPLFCFRTPEFLYKELDRAQKTIESATGTKPVHFRPPFGARWFGLRRAQQRLGLLGVMWTRIGGDWKLPADTVARRLLGAAGNGAILCLHDGRELRVRPDIGETLKTVRRLVPALLDRGFKFATIGSLVCPTTLHNA